MKNLNIRFLLFISIISSWFGPGLSVASAYAYHILLPPLTLISFFFLVDKKKVSLVTIFVLIGLFLYLIPMIYVTVTNTTLQYFVYALIGVSVMLSVVYYCSDKASIDLLLAAFKKFLWFLVFIGYLQVFLGFNWFFPLEQMFDRSIIDIPNLGTFVAPVGVFSNSNNFCVLLSASFALFFDASFRVKSFYWLSSVCFSLIGDSDMALMINVLSILLLRVYLYLVKKSRTGFNPLYSFVSTFLLLFLLITVENFTAIISKFFEKFFAILSYSPSINNCTTSICVRGFLSSVALQKIMTNGFYGLGPGGLYQYNFIFEDLTNGVFSPHNTLFEVLADGGLIFGLYLLILFPYLFIRLYYIILSADSFCVSCVSAQVLCFLVLFLVGSFGLSSAIYFLPFYFVLGLCFACIGIYAKG